MKFEALAIPGVWRVAVHRAEDERGHFARLWCAEAFAAAGLPIAIAQASSSFNPRAGTLRGLHFAWPPSQESKLVRCARGCLHDVLLDLRPHSASFGQSLAVVLDADTQDALLVPPGVAHGFQTLVNNTEVHYMMSEAYRAEWADGVRYNDPRFGIQWPLPVTCISPRDRDCADFDAAAHGRRFNSALQGAGRA